MSSDDQLDEKLLAGLDLHAWRVPPPRAEDRPAILVRALSPAAPRRVRTRRLVAGLVILNAVIAAILVVVIPRRSAPVVTSAPAGSVSDSLREITARLAQSQAELEERLAEVKRLRAEIEEMAAKVRAMEADNDRLRSQLGDKTVPRKAPATAPEPAPAAKAPSDPPPVDTSCDEVSCVLQNYPGTCCLKYRKQAPPPANPSLPDGIDRTSISAAMAQVKPAVEQCGQDHPAKGKVKVKVTVAPAGRVTNVVVEAAPDVALARCVANAVQKARFPATQHGGSFSYPFVF